MNLQSIRLYAISACVLFCCFQTLFAQTTENKLTPADERQIVEALLSDKFKTSPEKTIYISTANLSAGTLKNFPAPKNKTVRLVPAEKAGADELCAYEFGEFQFIDKFVSVTFGNCREGLAYDFMRDAGGWKGVGLVITRELFY